MGGLTMDYRDNGEDDVGTYQEIDGFEEPSLAAEDESVGSGDSGPRVSMTERLRDVMLGEGDGDLLSQDSDREGRVMQWLHALDMPVMGACRADERVKPLLKLSSASGGGAEDPLLAHLSQPSEVGMLARYFCMPLVSVRIGKVARQGTTLCPTSVSLFGLSKPEEALARTGVYLGIVKYAAIEGEPSGVIWGKKL